MQKIYEENSLCLVPFPLLNYMEVLPVNNNIYLIIFSLLIKHISDLYISIAI
jgi:hypothetical protein